MKTAGTDTKFGREQAVKVSQHPATQGDGQRNLPDQIVDLFLALIFMGDLKPGDRLPPELALTEILRVNRSSLRMAMRVLVRFRVIESNRGSGLTVLDHQAHAGINFITELLRIPELDMGSSFILEMLESAPEFIELLLNASIKNRGVDRNLTYIATLEQKISYLKSGSNPGELARLDIQMQDNASASFKNSIYRSAYNSFAPIRDYLMELYYSMGGDQLSYVENEKALSLAFLTQGIGEDEFRERFRQLVSDAVDEFRDYLTDLPKEPRLLVSPLQHYPEMVSLNSK